MYMYICIYTYIYEFIFVQWTKEWIDLRNNIPKIIGMMMHTRLENNGYSHTTPALCRKGKYLCNNRMMIKPYPNIVGYKSPKQGDTWSMSHRGGNICIQFWWHVVSAKRERGRKHWQTKSTKQRKSKNLSFGTLLLRTWKNLSYNVGFAYLFGRDTVLISFLLFATPGTAARQAPLSMRFSRQGYWSGLSCPLPGGLPHPGSNLCRLCLSLALVDRLLTPAPPGWSHNHRELIVRKEASKCRIRQLCSFKGMKWLCFLWASPFPSRTRSWGKSHLHLAGLPGADRSWQSG